jgi:inner membrane protein
MMSITHSAIAAAGCSLILGTADPITLSLAVLGSQLPDLDTTTSAIGQICFPVSSWIEDRFPHRSVTHSLLATFILTFISVFIGYLIGHLWSAIALPLGHLLACFSDTFTKQGVQLFFPSPAWAISVSNPRRRLKTGGASELWVLGGAIAALVISLYLVTGGGITQKVSQSLGLKDGVIAVYNDNAATHHVYADVTGVWASDRTRADGHYFIVGTSGTEFIISDGKGLYKTGTQIIVDRLTTSVGSSATTQIQTLNFRDEPAVAKLQQLTEAYPNAAIYLSGSVTIDFPDEMAIAIDPKQYQSASLAGSTLTLDYQPLETTLTQMTNQYALGTLTAKVILPKPTL